MEGYRGFQGFLASVSTYLSVIQEFFYWGEGGGVHTQTLIKIRLFYFSPGPRGFQRVPGLEDSRNPLTQKVIFQADSRINHISSVFSVSFFSNLNSVTQIKCQNFVFEH